MIRMFCISKKVSEYDHEIPQSHTTDQSIAQRERTIEYLQSQGIKKTIKVKKLALTLPSG